MNREPIYIMSECQVPQELIKNDILTESVVETATGKVKVVTIDTVLQSFDVKNWNQRIYGVDVVMEAIDNDGMIQNDIKHGQWVGEYGHPLDTDPKRQVSFYPPNCSHRILNYRLDGNLLKGHVQTLAEGTGSMMTSRILQGVPAAFSLRSLGSVDPETRRVQRPLKVLTYDSVFRPSHIEAYQCEILDESAGLISESKNLSSEHALFIPITESIEQIMDYINDKSRNFAVAAELFNLDKLNAVLTESGKVKLFVDDETTVLIPIEEAVQMQYHDVFSKAKLSLPR